MKDKSSDGRQVSGQKSSEGGRGDPQKASPAALERYIKGIHFPAEKQDLIKQAKSNKAPNDVMNVLNRLKEQRYNSPIDISKQVKDIE